MTELSKIIISLNQSNNIDLNDMTTRMNDRLQHVRKLQFAQTTSPENIAATATSNFSLAQ